VRVLLTKLLLAAVVLTLVIKSSVVLEVVDSNRVEHRRACACHCWCPSDVNGFLISI
jgi:hypothetical protein